MPKTFYTEVEIEDLFKRGVFSLELNDDVVLTDLAYEKALRLGVNLITGTEKTPPAAPQRPYIVSQQAPSPRLEAPQPAPDGTACPQPAATLSAGGVDLRQRIKDAVAARLGNVDAGLLDGIITRVLNSSGIK